MLASFIAKRLILLGYNLSVKPFKLVGRRALSNVADEGLLKEGFFWIPSLAGPTTLALQKSVRLPRQG